MYYFNRSLKVLYHRNIKRWVIKFCETERKTCPRETFISREFIFNSDVYYIYKQKETLADPKNKGNRNLCAKILTEVTAVSLHFYRWEFIASDGSRLKLRREVVESEALNKRYFHFILRPSLVMMLKQKLSSHRTQLWQDADGTWKHENTKPLTFEQFQQPKKSPGLLFSPPPSLPRDTFCAKPNNRYVWGPCADLEVAPRIMRFMNYGFMDYKIGEAFCIDRSCFFWRLFFCRLARYRASSLLPAFFDVAKSDKTGLSKNQNTPPL